MKNKKINTELGIIIVIIFAITVGVFVWKYSETQKMEGVGNRNVVVQPKVEENNKNNQEKNNIPNDSENVPIEKETELVSFCGKNFKTETIILENVDVIKRIAILSQDNKFRICENIITNSPKEEFSSKIEKQKNTAVDYKDGVYSVQISNLNFKIDTNENNIYIIGGYAGEPTFIGKLN